MPAHLDTVSAMTAPAPLPYDALEHIRLDGTELIRLISSADPTLSVPTCPEWSLGDLAHHVAKAWNFWAEVVSNVITDRTAIRNVAEPVRPTEHRALIDVLFDAHVRLCDALHAAPTNTEVWTWTGAPRPVSWVARRMVHETMVHLWDVGVTLGFDLEFVPAVAADGIDEWLTWFAASERGDGELKVGGTVHLHCTDDDLPDGTGEWFVSAMKEPGATFTREHRKGDAAVRGHAQDLLMWLWRRDDQGVEIIGNRDVAQRFRAFTDLH